MKLLRKLMIGTSYAGLASLLVILATVAADVKCTAILEKDYKLRMQYAPETIDDKYIASYNKMMPKDKQISLGHCDFEAIEKNDVNEIEELAKLFEDASLKEDK